MDWISVKDRLPPENTPVLAYIADRGTVILSHFYKDFALARCGSNGFADHGVTHWITVTPPRVSDGLGDILLTESEIDRVRQWFNSAQDVNPKYLEPADFDLAARIYQILGMRLPDSIRSKMTPNLQAQARAGSASIGAGG